MNSEGVTTNGDQSKLPINHCQGERLLNKNPHTWQLADHQAWHSYLATLAPAEQTNTEQRRRKKWRLSDNGAVETLSREDYERATGFYVGSAYDELGWSPEARCLYSHFVRRASLDTREMELWRRGRFKRTVKEGMRGITQWTGLCHATIENAINELVQLKLITVARDRGNRETNIYTLLPPNYWCNWLSTRG